MTQNMDSGTDLGFMFYFMETNPTLGVQLTFAEVMNSAISERAELLAEAIAAKQPDLVALQEATLWRTGETPAHANKPLFDQLHLLLAALAARGHPYKIVAVNELTDVALPMSATSALRYTDRDAIIARVDLPRFGVDISNVQMRRYQAIFVFAGIPALRGWISADVSAGGTTFRFVATHLESTFKDHPELTGYQVAQAQELIGVLSESPYPVVIAGDFNSNAASTPSEQTPTVPLLLGAGYADVWDAIYPAAPGFTWPLFLEDPLAPNPEGPYERIDLIFERGLSGIVSVETVGADPPYAADHAGVAARLLLGP